MALVTAMVITAVAAVGGAVTAYRGAQDAKDAARQQGETEEAYAVRQGAMIKRQAQDETEKIRRAAVEYRATQVANQAASGIFTGKGSAQVVRDKTTQLAEQDILLTLDNAEEGVLLKMEEGRMARLAGEARASAYSAQGRAAIWGGVAAVAGSAYTIFKE